MGQKLLAGLLGAIMLFSTGVFAGPDDDPTGWMGGTSGTSANLSLSLTLPKLYYMNVDKTESITGFTYALDTSGSTPTIKLSSYQQEIASILALSNDRTGYVIKVTSSTNSFALKNSDSSPASIAYTLSVADGSNYTGCSDVNTVNTALVTVGAASSISDLYVNGASLKINLPETSDLMFDNTAFSDALTIAISAD